MSDFPQDNVYLKLIERGMPTVKIYKCVKTCPWSNRTRKKIIRLRIKLENYSLKFAKTSPKRTTNPILLQINSVLKKWKYRRQMKWQAEIKKLEAGYIELYDDYGDARFQPFYPNDRFFLDGVKYVKLTGWVGRHKDDIKVQ